MTNQQPLVERIDTDLKQAMRERDDVAKMALRAVKTSLTEASKNKNNEALDADEAMDVVRKEAKRRRDAFAEYSRLDQEERAAQEQAELAVLERYLPRQLDEGEIEAIVREVIAEVDASSMRDMGQVMSATMPRVAGVADGRAVNSVVRRLLG